jgi:hypothetical protein
MPEESTLILLDTIQEKIEDRRTLLTTGTLPPVAQIIEDMNVRTGLS